MLSTDQSSVDKNTDVRFLLTVQPKLTFLGTATVLLEIDGLRILTDPVLESAGTRYRVGRTRLATYEHQQDPALGPEELAPIDLALVSHDHHKDNLDRAGRRFLEQVPTTLTTLAGAQRLTTRHGVRALGLAPWQTHEVTTAGGDTLRITATPAKHSPGWLHPIVGDVIGFALEHPAWGGKALWISGDTLRFPGLEAIAKRFDIGLALVHVGAGGFGITGPIRYSFNARDLVAISHQMQLDQVVPIHFEGWSHFREGRRDIEGAVAKADRRGRHPELASRLRWLTPGEPTELSVENDPASSHCSGSEGAGS